MSEAVVRSPATRWLRFLGPSLIGVLFFLTPFSTGDQITVGMAYVGDLFIEGFKTGMVNLAAACIVISLFLTILFALHRPSSERFKWLAASLSIHPVWFPLRLFGAIAAVAYVSGTGPDWLIGGATAGTTLGNLIPITMTYLGIASVFLPLLVDFGLMEMVGVLLSRVFYRVFRLPGRSAIDALASWMGSGPVGVLITSQQYERGYYTAREAAVICTNFSVVSVSFSLVVIEYIGLGHLFPQFYACVIGIGLIAALITPRLPPLRGMPDKFIDGSSASGPRDFSQYATLWEAASSEALQRADNAPSPQELVQRIGRSIAELWFSLIPVVMGLGTSALILAEYTPIFQWLGAPLVPLLQLFGLAEAEAAAPLMLIGFTDMYLPALVGVNLDSEMTRFVVAVMSVTQLIYMSETGALIVKSAIPLNFRQVVILFLLRTAISLPIAALAAHLLL